MTGNDYPPHILREYSLLADGERGAVIGPRGEIAWMCAPRWESPSIFGGLVGAAGVYAVTPVGRFVWGGYYERGSLIWRNRWVTSTGIVECREALAFPGDPHRAVLLRRVEARQGDATLDIVLDPRWEYGAEPTTDVRRDGRSWVGRVGFLHLRWTGAPEGCRPLHDHGGISWRGRLEVPAGGGHDLVLEISDRPLTEPAPDPGPLWEATGETWRREVPEFKSSLIPQDARQSYAVMRGLTADAGGMVAAATTSLPERADGNRNYDYRYAWIRDTCFAGQAVAADGPHPLLDRAVAFVADRLLADGPSMKPAYVTGGGRVPDESHLNLPGYPGGSDIVGNHVNEQFQLDAFGESLLLLAAAARLDRLDGTGWSAAETAARAIAERWREPDAGIWELSNQPWTHSRLIAAAGLRAMAAVAPRAAPTSGQTARWLSLADAITADTAEHGLSAAGTWQRSPDDPGLDAALLLVPLRGGLPADDPRSVATLDAYLDSLTHQGYAFRFREGDLPLGRSEGAFLLCGFAVAMALHQAGRPVEAARWFERTRAACGPPQLYSEEYDPVQNQMRGNLPQAFVHAFLLESSIRLADDPDVQAGA